MFSNSIYDIHKISADIKLVFPRRLWKVDYDNKLLLNSLYENSPEAALDTLLQELIILMRWLQLRWWRFLMPWQIRVCGNAWSVVKNTNWKEMHLDMLKHITLIILDFPAKFVEKSIKLEIVWGIISISYTI